MTTKTFSTFVLAVFVLCALLCVPVLAQGAAQGSAAQDDGDGELVLRLSRNFGYSSGRGEIQGTFTLKARGPDDLARVVFYLDGERMGEDTEAPFDLLFDTGSYDLGLHTFSATGTTTNGRELQADEIRAEFVSAEEGWQAAGQIAIPVLAITFGVIVLSFLASFLSAGRLRALPPGAPRSYGPLGGTVCPRCGRPFAIHLFGLNMVAGKLDRCPYCGKWSLVRRAPMEVLRAAEAAEVESAETAVPAPPLSDEEALRKELDDSRFSEI